MIFSWIKYYFTTNQHYFQVVKVILADGSNLQGQVVFKTRPATLTTQNTGTSRQGKSVWDLAIIVTARSLPSSLPLASEIPPKGEELVFVLFLFFKSNI